MFVDLPCDPFSERTIWQCPLVLDRMFFNEWTLWKCLQHSNGCERSSEWYTAPFPDFASLDENPFTVDGGNPLICILVIGAIPKFCWIAADPLDNDSSPDEGNGFTSAIILLIPFNAVGMMRGNTFCPSDNEWPKDDQIDDHGQSANCEANGQCQPKWDVLQVKHWSVWEINSFYHYLLIPQKQP